MAALCCLWMSVSGCTALGVVVGCKLDHPSQQAVVPPEEVRVGDVISIRLVNGTELESVRVREIRQSPDGGAPTAFVIVNEERLRAPRSFSSREDEELLVVADDLQWIAKDREGLEYTLALGGLGFGLDLLGAYFLGVDYPTRALE